MNEKYVNPFLVPLTEVWLRRLGQSLDLRFARRSHRRTTSERCTIILGVSGDVRGVCLYELSRRTAGNVAKVLLGDGRLPPDAIGLSSLRELCQIISGEAEERLARAGYACSIAPAALSTLAGIPVKGMADKQITLYFGSKLGPVTVRVSLTDEGADERGRPRPKGARQAVSRLLYPHATAAMPPFPPPSSGVFN